MSPYTALSQWQSSVAAGNAGMISLWDLRSAARTFHLQLADAQQVRRWSSTGGCCTVHILLFRLNSMPTHAS